MRGQLNDEVQDIAEKRLGRPLTCIAELRLLPYLDYLMKNQQKIDPRKINTEEREILRGLKKEGHIEGGAVGLKMTKEFYDAIQEILWQAYVVQGAEEHNVHDEMVLRLMMEEEE
jgi:hypothetical protein